MDALTFWKRVTADHSNFLESLTALLERAGVPYCVIGGVGVNAFVVEPLISLDLDLVIHSAAVESLLRSVFVVKQVSGGFDVSSPGSKLRVHIHTDQQYLDFIDRASRRDVFGLELPVAAPADLVRGLTWSGSRTDLLYLQRIVEVYPHLRDLVPAQILDRFA